jgi:ribosomal protein S18 acetylase RimI-like enzyme
MVRRPTRRRVTVGDIATQTGVCVATLSRGLDGQAHVAPDTRGLMRHAAEQLGVKPGDRGEQFAFDITDDSRQMFVTKANGQVIAHGRVAEMAAEEAAPGTPAGCYLSGVLVDPAWRRRGIATALTRARLRWAFAPYRRSVLCNRGG